MKTLLEVARLLKQYDVEQVCELLDISSEEIVERFMDILEERQDEVRRDLDADDEDDEFDNDWEY